MSCIKKLLILILSVICAMTSLSLIACSSNEKVSTVKITFTQDGAEDVVLDVQKGGSIEELPPLAKASESYLVREWNISDNFVATKDSTIYAIEYTKGLVFEETSHEGNRTYTVSEYNSKNTKVIIPDYYKGGQVRSIKSKVFWQNNDITEVVLPDTLVSLQVGVFGIAKNLKKINIPSSLTNLNSHVFADSGIGEGEAFIVPENVKTAELRALWATKYEMMYLTGSLQSAGEFSFGGSSCKTIVWGLNLTSVCDNTFYAQPIESIYYMGDESDWKAIEWKDVVYDGSASSKNGAKVKILGNKNVKIYYVSDWEMVDGVPTPIN